MCRRESGNKEEQGRKKWEGVDFVFGVVYIGRNSIILNKGEGTFTLKWLIPGGGGGKQGQGVRA